MYSVAPKDILFWSERAEGISGEQQTLAGKNNSNNKRNKEERDAPF